MKRQGLYDRTSGQRWRHCGHGECVFFHIIKNVTLCSQRWQMVTRFYTANRRPPSFPFTARPVRTLKRQNPLCRTKRVAKQIGERKIQGIYAGERMREGERDCCGCHGNANSIPRLEVGKKDNSLSHWLLCFSQARKTNGLFAWCCCADGTHV